jgi:hypothetical protein
VADVLVEELFHLAVERDDVLKSPYCGSLKSDSIEILSSAASAPPRR